MTTKGICQCFLGPFNLFNNVLCYAHVMLQIVLSDINLLQAFSTCGQIAGNHFPLGAIKGPESNRILTSKCRQIYFKPAGWITLKLVICSFNVLLNCCNISLISFSIGCHHIMLCKEMVSGICMLIALLF